jgi:pyruvate dehydrogenase E2 component (dihydrolipoamide acetyltransferase)
MPYEFKLPDIGEGVVEGEIVRWLIQEGDNVIEDQPMVEVMTDKANVEIPSPISGTVTRCIGKEGDIIQVGDTLVVIQAGEESGPAPKTSTVEPPQKGEFPAEKKDLKKESSQTVRIQATPAVRRKAREMGIDLNTVAGSGPSGRITLDDLDRVIPSVAEVPMKETSISTKIPYRGIRRKIGKHLQKSVQTAVHYTYLEEVDVTELVALRDVCARDLNLSHLTYLPFILKAVALGLRKYPVLNSSLDEEREEILLKQDYNIGIATATDQGLVVPVVKNVDKKSIVALADEIQSLIDKTRKGKASLADLQDGTFTVTSLGPLGGLAATPVINFPEVAILGIHKIRQAPVVMGGQITIRNIMNVSIAADHRVIDGATAAEFIHFVKRFLEHPGLLALES